jgi:hypothetical protein
MKVKIVEGKRRGQVRDRLLPGDMVLTNSFASPRYGRVLAVGRREALVEVVYGVGDGFPPWSKLAILVMCSTPRFSRELTYYNLPDHWVYRVWAAGMTRALVARPLQYVHITTPITEQGWELESSRKDIQQRFNEMFDKYDRMAVQAAYTNARSNPFVAERGDPQSDLHRFEPPFEPSDIKCVRSSYTLLNELRGHCWANGVGFAIGDVAFVNQVNGGSEWLAIKDGQSFESVSWDMVIEYRGMLHAMRQLRSMLRATREQCISNWSSVDGSLGCVRV